MAMEAEAMDEETSRASCGRNSRREAPVQGPVCSPSGVVTEAEGARDGGPGQADEKDHLAMAGGGGWRSQKRGWEQQHQQETATVASLDPTLQKLLTTLTRAVLRHEPDLTLDTSPRSFLLQKLQEAGENGTTGWICTAKGRSRDR